MSHGVKLTVPQQVNHMKQQGIAFTIMDEQEALTYLTENNNYFKLRAYRKNYPQNGEGRYIGLEFAYLKDIAIIDMRLRYCFLEMCLDIEHALRVRIIKEIVDTDGEDGYTVVDDFAEAFAKDYEETLLRASRSPYCADLLEKYSDRMPIWVLVEMMQFSILCKLYRFVGQRIQHNGMCQDFYLLQDIRQLRNACAHSNCVLNDLQSHREQAYRPNSSFSLALSRVPGISRDVRQRKLSNARIRQIAILMYAYNHLVTSESLRAHRAKDLRHEIADRYERNEAYYTTSEPIRSTFAFFRRMLDFWYPPVVE